MLPVSSDAILVFLGLGFYLAACLVTRRPLTWAWALLPGFCVSVILEGWEIWDHYGMQGLLKLEARGLVAILVRHSRDVLVTNLAPSLVFLVALSLERLAQR